MLEKKVYKYQKVLICMKKDVNHLSYLVLGLFLVFVAVSILISSGVSAALSVDVSDADNVTTVSIDNPSELNLYSYEVNFESTGSYSVNQDELLGSGVQGTYGSLKMGSDLSVYGSHLGSDGIAADGRAFRVSYSGELNPLTALIILANTTEINLCLSGDCCGDDIVQTDEECDGGEGCSASCEIIEIVCGDGVVSDGEACDLGDGNGVCPSTCSSSCTTNSCTDEPNGGGGGGGGGVTTSSNVKIVSNVDQITVGLVVGQSPVKEFKLTNDGEQTVTFGLRVSGLPESIKMQPSSLTLAPGETGVVSVTFADIKQGLFAGNIIVDVAGNVVSRIPVTINVKTSNFIYDLRVNVPFEFKYILPGQSATAEIDFKKIGNANAPAKVDVYYVVKDFTGRTILEQKESLEITGDKSYSKQIDTSKLTLGKYIIGVEAVYPGAYASSSTQFEVVSKEPINPVWLYLAIVVSLVIAGVLAVGLNKKKKQILSKKYSRY